MVRTNFKIKIDGEKTGATLREGYYIVDATIDNNIKRIIVMAKNRELFYLCDYDINFIDFKIIKEIDIDNLKILDAKKLIRM